MAVDRAQFIVRIANALIRGERKLGRELSPTKAIRQATQIADKLGALFDGER